MGLNWLEDAVFYEIYPQSFFDTNSDGIGDLKGIEKKLDYIVSLGCNAVWMNPMYESPFRDAGYDITDHKKVAPRYGTEEDFDSMLRAMHDKGLKLLLDLVPGHTSDLHPWFLQSMDADRNEYTDRYIWTDAVWKSPSVRSVNGWLRGISDRDGCAAVNFYSSQPALNYGFFRKTEDWMQTPDEEGPRATLEAMKDVIRFWLKKGVDGFRVDMAGFLIKNDEEDRGIKKLWNEVFDEIRTEFPSAAFVSEWGNPSSSLKAGFDMDFLLHFGPSHYLDLFREKPYFSRKPEGSAEEFVKTYEGYLHDTAGKGLVCIPSGNHDMERISYTLTAEETKLAFFFLFTMPGCPFLYYGDEIGMRYQHLRSKEGGYTRTGARTPMQWTDGKNAGFSEGDASSLYLPVDTEKGHSVEAEEKNPDSLLHEVRRLIKLRHSEPGIQAGSSIRFLRRGEDGGLMAYLRGEHLLVLIAPKRMERFPLEGGATKLAEVGGKSIMERGGITLEAGSASIWRV